MIKKKIWKNYGSWLVMVGNLVDLLKKRNVQKKTWILIHRSSKPLNIDWLIILLIVCLID